jgi:hypothetical protein
MQGIIFLGINAGFGYILGRIWRHRAEVKFDFELGNEDVAYQPEIEEEYEAVGGGYYEY